MNQVYLATILDLDDDVEEEVLLRIEGHDIVCFASVAPYALQEGQVCPVILELQVFDQYEVTASESAVAGFDRIGHGFGYRITGRLYGDALDAGIVFHNEMFRTFGLLQDRFVTVVVNRIDAQFLEE
ncbi:MAG: hypothetical protein AAB393_19495 [Bacteroidota bacterium]